MSTRTDFWKTFSVLRILQASGLVNPFEFGEESCEELIDMIAGRFKKEMLQHNLSMDAVALYSARSSWEWFLINLFLYSECLDSYVSIAALELSHLCAQFHCQPTDVFRNDWICMSNKKILLAQLGSEEYYAHPIYMSHLWIENVAARRMFFVHHIQALTNTKRLVLSKCRILDIGSGMAGSLRLFPQARERIGIDISEPMVRWCNETSNEGERYAVMDCRATDYPNDSFDIVLCFDVLEHILEPRKVLTEIARVVRPDGVVAIVYPFGANDWDNHISLVGKCVFDDWLERSGYEVLAEVTAPGEVFPCSVCYLLRAS